MHSERGVDIVPLETRLVYRNIRRGGRVKRFCGGELVLAVCNRMQFSLRLEKIWVEGNSFFCLVFGRSGIKDMFVPEIVSLCRSRIEEIIRGVSLYMGIVAYLSALWAEFLFFG